MLFLLCLIKLKLLYSFLSIISAPDYNSHSFLSRLLFFYWLYSVPKDRIYLAMWLEPWYSVSAKNWSAFSMPNLKKRSSDPQCWLLLLLIYHGYKFHSFQSFCFITTFSLRLSSYFAKKEWSLELLRSSQILWFCILLLLTLTLHSVLRMSEQSLQSWAQEKMHLGIKCKGDKNEVR